jgi:DNA gyrase subunit A
MRLRSKDSVVGMAAIRPGQSLLTVCENGYGKRTGIEEYRLTKRGAQGVINIKTTDRNGQVVGLLSVSDNDEVMFITANGIMLRTGLEAIREIGRATQGVRLIRVDDGDKVVAVAKIAPDEEATAEGAAVETAGETPAPEPDTRDAAESPPEAPQEPPPGDPNGA